MKRLLPLFFLPALASAGTHVHKDWAAACSDRRACTAFGFAPAEDGDAWLKLVRDGAPAASATARVAFHVEDGDRPGPVALLIDGRPLAVEPVPVTAEGNWAKADFDAAATTTIVDAIRNGTTLELAVAGVVRGRVSLAGSAAALLWVDEQQGRLGTTTALVRRGTRLPASVPPVPNAGVVHIAPPVSQDDLPTTDTAPLRALLGDCDEDLPDEPEAALARLSAHEVLYAPLCTRGAYNFVHGFVVVDERAGSSRVLEFAPAPGGGEPQTLLMNIEFDPATWKLTTFSKARGLGDCGDFTTYAWDGRTFRPVRADVMPECRGVMLDEWPTLFELDVRAR